MEQCSTSAPLNAYEQERQDRIERNRQFLAQLGIQKPAALAEPRPVPQKASASFSINFSRFGAPCRPIRDQLDSGAADEGEGGDIGPASSGTWGQWRGSLHCGGDGAERGVNVQVRWKMEENAATSTRRSN